MTGRRTKLTPARHKAIVESLRRGATIKATAKAVGVGDSTLRNWLTLGEQESGTADQRALREATLKAEGHVMTGAETTLAMHALGVRKTDAKGKELPGWEIAPDWKAALKLLERRDPDTWGRKDHHTFAGDPDRPVVDGDALLRKLQQMAGDTDAEKD